MPERGRTGDAAIFSALDMVKIFPAVVRMLAQGRPVPLTDLAWACGRSVDEVRKALRSQPGTDWDDEGRLLGFGLTLRPTAHRFTVDGGTLYGWCAADTLYFALILGKEAVVESTCPESKSPIRIRLTPAGVIDVDPPGTVVSRLADPNAIGDIRSNLCDEGLFFASAAAAASWLAAHPSGSLTTVEGALDRCREALSEIDA